ncbi:MAG: helix-turn-helix domain-containing protein [Pyrinomonadaceae bacterium]
MAVQLFSQRGFKGTTTREIAQAAGVSEAMVFRHFANKSALYDAILDHKSCTDGIHEFPWQGNPAIKQAIDDHDDYSFFYNIALDAMNNQQRDEGFLRLLFYSALEEHELADRFFDQFITRVYQFIGGYIKKRQAGGAMRDFDPAVCVRAFLGMMIHHSLNNVLWDRDRRHLNITNDEAAKNFAEILLQGVLVKSTTK